MKKHHCCRCRRHLANVVDVARKSGSLHSFCKACIKTLRNKANR